MVSTFQPGQLLVCSSGEYDDFRVHGVYRVQRGLDATALAAFLAAPPVVPRPPVAVGAPWLAHVDRYSPAQFLTWLVAQGYLTPEPYAELWVGTSVADFTS